MKYYIKCMPTQRENLKVIKDIIFASNIEEACKTFVDIHKCNTTDILYVSKKGFNKIDKDIKNENF